ncbi:hypothetical protein BC833DRAFT_603398 [Globomyces pollinis-pini]|nr:hypothetical protein BC833DRAFT_603398 [Globomyces pollinis-pini]
MTLWIAQSSWESYDCVGIPSLIRTFPDSTIPSSNEYFNIKNTFPSLSLCGQHVRTDSGCCYSAIPNAANKLSNNGRKSVLHSSYTSNDPSIPLHTLSNAQKYCQLTNAGSNSWPYNDTFVLADGVCHDRFICSTSGELAIFSVEGCTGIQRKFSLSNEPITVLSTIGSHMVRLKDVENTTIQTSWVTYWPPNTVTADRLDTHFWLSVTFHSLALVGTLGVLIYYAYLFHHSKTVFLLGYMISQIFWLIFILFDVVQVHVAMPGQTEGYLMVTFTAISLGIAMLVSTLITGNILLIFMRLHTRVNQKIFLTVLLGFHFCLAGTLYLSPFFQRDSHGLVFWSQLVPLFIIFMYFFDIAPALFVFRSIINSHPDLKDESMYKKLLYLIELDSFIIIYFLLQILNAVGFIGLYYIQRFTLLLQNDAHFNLMEGPICFSYVFHTLVSCALNAHIRHLLNVQSNGNSSYSTTHKSGLDQKKKNRRISAASLSLQTANLDNLGRYRNSSNSGTIVSPPPQSYSPVRHSHGSQSEIVTERYIMTKTLDWEALIKSGNKKPPMNNVDILLANNRESISLLNGPATPPSSPITPTSAKIDYITARTIDWEAAASSGFKNIPSSVDILPTFTTTDPGGVNQSLVPDYITARTLDWEEAASSGFKSIPNSSVAILPTARPKSQAFARPRSPLRVTTHDLKASSDGDSPTEAYLFNRTDGRLKSNLSSRSSARASEIVRQSSVSSRSSRVSQLARNNSLNKDAPRSTYSALFQATTARQSAIESYRSDATDTE